MEPIHCANRIFSLSTNWTAKSEPQSPARKISAPLNHLLHGLWGMAKRRGHIKKITAADIGHATFKVLPQSFVITNSSIRVEYFIVVFLSHTAKFLYALITLWCKSNPLPIIYKWFMCYWLSGLYYDSIFTVKYFIKFSDIFLMNNVRGRLWICVVAGYVPKRNR